MSQNYELSHFDALLEDQTGFKPESREIGCFQCGWCCRYYKIFITPEELDFISRETGLAVWEIAEFRSDLNWFGEENLFLLREPGGCIFLKRVPGTKRRICGIHHIKPMVCRKFAASLEKPVCQQGLAEVWRLIVGPSRQVEGEEGRVKEFGNFLEEIKG